MLVPEKFQFAFSSLIKRTYLWPSEDVKKKARKKGRRETDNIRKISPPRFLFGTERTCRLCTFRTIGELLPTCTVSLSLEYGLGGTFNTKSSFLVSAGLTRPKGNLVLQTLDGRTCPPQDS
jgi:hypothetical protein